MYNYSNIINLNESYNFYKKYHQNYENKLIHVFSIPLIAFSLSVLLSNIIPFKVLGIKIKANFLLLSFYLLLYSTMDPIFFYPMGLFLYLIFSFSELFKIFVKNYYFYAFIIHCISWILQFSGHYLFEGNKPALLDSLSQSFLMAPLFSYLEFKELFLDN